MRSLVPNTIPLVVFGTRILRYWVLGRSGEAKQELHWKVDRALRGSCGICPTFICQTFILGCCSGTCKLSYHNIQQPRNHPLRHHKYHLTETIRPLLELPGGVYRYIYVYIHNMLDNLVLGLLQLNLSSLTATQHLYELQAAAEHCQRGPFRKSPGWRQGPSNGELPEVLAYH